MKRLQMFLAAFLLVFLLPLISAAQDSIPNAGFEQWTAGDPEGWLTSNADPFYNVTQSSDAHSGNWAAHGTVADFFGFAIQPYLIAATAGEPGIPINERWASVRGFYKMNPDSGDKFIVDVVFSKASNPVAAGGFVDSNVVLSYQEFVVNMTYFSSDVPDTAFITITMVGPNGADYHNGSVMIVDDISLSGVATAVEEQADQKPMDFELRNYPNPFNPQTTISYILPQSSPVRLQIFNLLGQPVRTWAEEEQSAGRHSVVWDGRDDNGKALSSGVYFYRLESKGRSEVKKMLLLK
ncbi:MAG TPA: T9SS type A sorting domain-containing protein [Verrucomicrobiae bacterium]|nr:T9SS type A sorting domain-containing protein [Verrucomicrobiae bacterium]